MSEKDCPKEKKVKNWGTGGGMYRGVKASVKSLNYVIVSLVALLVIVVIYLASTSSYKATFEVNGGESIAVQSYKYGEMIKVEVPLKTGYIFDGWYENQDLSKPWIMDENIVEGNITLYAKWKPANIHILFDVNGGYLADEISQEGITRLFHEPYGELPIPSKENQTFIGWQYDGKIMQSDTIVTMNGEHTLKAIYASL